MANIEYNSTKLLVLTLYYHVHLFQILENGQNVHWSQAAGPTRKVR